MTRSTEHTAEQRFASAVNELNRLKAEGYEVNGLHRLSLSATAKVEEAETKEAEAKPARRLNVKIDDEVKS